MTRGFIGDYAPAPSGNTILTTGDGSGLAIDFSKSLRSRRDARTAGPAAGEGDLQAGGIPYKFLFLGGQTPEPHVNGDEIVIGGQTVSFRDGRIVLEKK